MYACFHVVPLEQRKALLLENEKLKSSTENEIGTYIIITSIIVMMCFMLFNSFH